MADPGVRMNEVFLDWLDNAREELLKSGGTGDDRTETELVENGFHPRDREDEHDI